MLPATALSKANWLFGYLGARGIEGVKRLMLFPFEMEIKEDSLPSGEQLDVEEMESLLYSTD
jgi:hypothetical protein